MKSTSRLRVLSDRIPRVLVFVYFCRGLLGNTEERPTCRDYIEMSTCRAIILHLKTKEAKGTKRRPNGDWPWAPAQEIRAPVPLQSPIRTLFWDQAPPTQRIKDNRSINVGLIQWPIFTWRDYKTRPLALGGESLSSLINKSSREKKPLIKPRATTSIRHLDQHSYIGLKLGVNLRLVSGSVKKILGNSLIVHLCSSIL